MKCPECGFESSKNTHFCGNCGAEIDSKDKAPVSATKTIESPADEFTRGTYFAGRYEIIEELGSGGMGKVYRAYDTKIKVLAILGIKDEAIELLDEDILKREIMPYIHYFDLLNNPFYDNLRDDPRFIKMVDREKKLYEEASERFEVKPWNS